MAVTWWHSRASRLPWRPRHRANFDRTLWASSNQSMNWPARNRAARTHAEACWAVRLTKHCSWAKVSSCRPVPPAPNSKFRIIIYSSSTGYHRCCWLVRNCRRCCSIFDETLRYSTGHRRSRFGRLQRAFLRRRWGWRRWSCALCRHSGCKR